MKSYLSIILVLLLINTGTSAQADLVISGTAPVPEFIGQEVSIQLWPTEQNYATVTVDENGEFNHVFDLQNSSLNGSVTVSHCEGVFQFKTYGMGNMDLNFELGTCSDSSLYFGCTDPFAINFSSYSNMDDGSCVYSECNPVQYPICYNDELEDFVIPSTGNELILTWNQSWYFYEGDNCRIYDGVDASGELLMDFEDYFAEGGMLISQSGNLFFDFELDPESSSCEEMGINPLVFEVYCGTVPVPGCTDPSAVNYGAEFGVDDGSCLFSNCEAELITYCYGNNESEFWIEAVDEEPILIQILSGSLEEDFDYLNIYDGTDESGTLIYGPSNGDQSDVALTAFSGFMYFSFDADATVSCQSGSESPLEINVYCGNLVMMGCTDPAACNYEPNATADDGSCMDLVENDDCANAIPISVDGSLHTIDNTCSTGDGLGPDCWYGDSAENDVWFSFVASGTGLLVIETFEDGSSTLVDTQIALYADCGGVEIACDDDGSTGLFSRIELAFSELQEGQTYFIRVNGYDATSGTANISVSVEQLYGCTDSEALNYSSDATADDGSCVYNSDCEVSFTWEVNVDSAQVHVFVPELEDFPGAEYFWSFGDGSTTSYPYPIYYYQSEGTYEVCLTVSDPENNCYDSYCENITYSGFTGSSELEMMMPAGFTLIVNPAQIIGIDEQLALIDDLELYPNPTSPENIKMRINLNMNEVVQIEVYDMTSRLIHSTSMQLNQGMNDVPLELSGDFNTGMYLVRVIAGRSDNQITKKVFFK